jgi:hypothetical protein
MPRPEDPVFAKILLSRSPLGVAQIAIRSNAVMFLQCPIKVLGRKFGDEIMWDIMTLQPSRWDSRRCRR